MTSLRERRGEQASKRFLSKRLGLPATQGLPTYPLLGTAQDEEGLNAVFLEVGVALATTAWLHLIVPIQVVECGLGDVDASTVGEGQKQ